MIQVNYIYNENCIDTMKKFPKNLIDLVVTSPPYDKMREYDGYQLESFQQIAQELYRVIKDDGVIVWIVGDQTIKGNETGTAFRQALYFKEIGFNLFDTMIYQKSPQGAVGNNKTYWQSFEYMFVLTKSEPKTINLIKDRKNKDVRDDDRGTKRFADGRLESNIRKGYGEYGRRTNIWEYETGKGHSASNDIAYKHPAIFPEKLAKDHIITWTYKKDIVYDPFMGSGTVGVVCKNNDRIYIGSEINRKYCKIADRRISDTKKQLKIDL